jgi:N-acetylmuramoyl-L-alanine amidase
MNQISPDSPLAKRVMPSPNHGERRGSTRPDSLVLHYTGMPTGASALAWLCNPIAEVSSHYFVEEDGTIIQLVPESRRAWHAGRSIWAGETDMNSRSIGIEIVNPGHEGGSPPFPARQIEAVIALCDDLCRRHGIAAPRVLAHSDIAPARKADPGEFFPWDTLRAAGIGHYVEPTPLGGGRFFSRGDQGPPVEAIQAMLGLYGYGISIDGRFDEATEQVVRAFQRHFRPARVDGVADVSTIVTLRDLIAALPARPRADA